MNRAEAINEITRALAKVTGKSLQITENTHLLDDGIIDSLDGIKFVFELEKAASVQLPEGDLAELGLYNVGTLADFVSKHGSA